MNTARLIDYSSSDEEVADKSACQTDDRKKKDTDKRKDKKLLEDELKRIEREKAEEEYDRWKLKEDEFLKKQLIEQSKIRIENRREEPIDYFMKIIFIYKGELKMDDGINVELMRHPKKIVDRLNKTETESLLEKCDVYKKLEKIDDFKAFWDHIQALALYHQERLIKYELKKRGNISIQTAISDEYNEDVESILKEDQAKTFLNSADLNVDIEFWDQVLNRVQVQKAVMGLEMIHSKHREKLTLDPTNPTDSNPQNGNKQETEGRNNSGMNEFVRSDPLSPRLYKGDDFGASVRIFTEDDYKRRIDTLRGKCYQNELTLLTKQAQKELELRKMKDIGNVNDLNEVSEEEDEGELTEEARRFKEIMKSAENKVEDDEIAFDDIEQTKKSKDWIDKFKPRKPHYFNRVKMGYEWNRVNQAHYDLETPPPKQVLGYKFNVFYPNLLSKEKPPTYELTPAETKEFCIIKFMAGPPYEDLAFKIVNREWDYSDRQGFKCIFDRGILHLHFNFKMARYRR